MITEDKYCKGCGQKLNMKSGFFSRFIQKNYFQIDGDFYCEVCAREVVKKRRAMLK